MPVAVTGRPSFDVAVVGGGPAGASAARAAALAGARVVLLDRASFPRYKTCGGGLVPASVAALPSSVLAALPKLVRAVGERLTVASDGRRQVSSAAGTAGPLLRMVMRDDLDAALVAAATDAGVELREGVTVTRVEVGRDGAPLLRCAAGPVRAGVVVGADGSASRVGAHVGVRLAQVDVGLEVELTVPPDLAREWAGRVHLDWGPLPGSYGWVFPKGDLLSVGVIGARADGPALRTYRRDLLSRLGLDSVDGVAPARDSGHLTRVRVPGSPLVRGRVLVAGDAAGLLEPWTREGISYALRSGALAGAAAARAALGGGDAELASYRSEVEGGLGREMRAGRLFFTAFARHRDLTHCGLLVPRVGFAVFRRVVAGEASFAGAIERPVVRAALRALGAL